MQITMSMDDVFKRFAARIEQAGRQAPQVMANGLNAGGRAVRRETVAAEAEQTGLSKRIINRAQKESPATPARLVYAIRSAGGNVRLKYFGARETRGGVSAAPWNERKVFPSSFIKGGRFPERVALGMGGHVFSRTGSSRLPIASGKSGLFIPAEMVTGETASAFTTGSSTALRTVTHAVGRAFGAN